MRLKHTNTGSKRIKKKFAFMPVFLNKECEWLWLEFYYSHQEYKFAYFDERFVWVEYYASKEIE